MDIISIKVHPPWYARGTPITNTRDGPPFDLSAYVVPDNVKMEAIREGPSARGNPVEVRSRQSAVGSQNHDSYRMEDQSRGNPGRKTRLWLTLKTTFSNTQNRVYSQWYAQIQRVIMIVEMILLCILKTRRVAMIIENDMTYKPKTRRVDKIIDDKICISTKPRRVNMIIAMAKIVESQTRRVEKIIENEMMYKPKTRRVDKIIGKNEWRKYHPVGVSVPHFNSCYNHNIPLGLRTKPRRVDKIIDDKICISNKTRRVATIIENGKTYKPKTRRVDKIIDKNEWRKYHPVGVYDRNRLLCYNHNIPLGLKTKPTFGRINLIAI